MGNLIKQTLLPALAAFLLLFQLLSPIIPLVLAQEVPEEEDTTPPTDPADVHSTSHEVDAQSNNNFIQMAWSAPDEPNGASDEDSGVDGYSVSFSQVPEDLPDDSKDLEEDATDYSEILSDGSWYFHLRTVDNAGNWTSTVHTGPYIIDTAQPLSTLNSPSDDSVWGQSGIYIEGSSTDIPQTTVSYVTLWAYSYADDEWFEITILENLSEEEPFNWSYTWIPTYEGDFDIVAEATDKAGNTDYDQNAYAEYVTYDITPPESEITSPLPNSAWNSPIPIEGNSQDSTEIPVDSVSLFYEASGQEEDNWTEIDVIPNDWYESPFYWLFYWTPDEEGTYDIKVEAVDAAGNNESSPVVEVITYDVTDPVSAVSYPEKDASYSEDEWEGEIRGTAQDNTSGINSVLVSIQRDSDSLYWNGEGWSIGEGDGEILNQTSFEEGSWDYDFGFIEPEGADEGYTVRSHAIDNAQNQEDTSEVHFFFSHGLPVISNENTVDVGSAQVTFVWDTDIPATSRVVYDTVSHPDPLGEAPNYNYANSTGEYDTDPKVTSHTVVVCCFDQSTTYYYRVISQGSPEAASAEKTFSTPATPPQSINPNSQQGTTTTTTATAATGTVAGATTQTEPGQFFTGGTGGTTGETEEVLGEATPAASPNKSPQILGTESQEQSASQAKKPKWLIILLVAVFGVGILYFLFGRRPKKDKTAQL